jgi:hypothetical protein
MLIFRSPAFHMQLFPLNRLFTWVKGRQTLLSLQCWLSVSCVHVYTVRGLCFVRRFLTHLGRGRYPLTCSSHLQSDISQFMTNCLPLSLLTLEDYWCNAPNTEDSGTERLLKILQDSDILPFALFLKATVRC